MNSKVYWVALVLSFPLFTEAQSIQSAPFKSLNSKYDEQNPVIGPDALYFTVGNHPQNIAGKKDLGDIWVSVWVGGAWSKPIHGGDVINDAAYNSVAGFSPDGKTMFLLSHYGKKGTLATTQGISISKLGDYGWSAPENISMPYFLNRSNSLSGMINASENIFVFAADSYNTKGVEDIYVSFKKDGKWGEPINLGGDINTPYQELSPSLSEDGKIIYFSTNGRNGEGGFDIFKSTRLDDTWQSWSRPENVESLINTEARELFYRPFTKGSAFFTTTRNSDGYGDIRAWIDTVDVKNHQYLNRKSVVQISGTITNSKTGAAVKAKIFFKTDSLQFVYASEDGNYSIKIPTNKSYTIEILSIGYVNLSDRADLQVFDLKNLQMNFKLQPIEVGTVVQMKNVLFYMGTTKLLEESYSELNVVVGFLNDNPQIEIELEGHTDNRGDSKKNMVLSQQRVDVIKKYLVSRGINAKRLKGRGYGDTRPIATNENEESRKLNRRVEFLILKN
ncbi:MAG: OmpA family protein [Bacteroidetes bacterium]|nr:OmpA family protein [Bacteroidota bacterium]MBI3481445.1 OmpA family protein [Bacteroidota bacterium]